ncbi:MAG: CocE/NonD family hydrolase [Gemmatimonadales bacterium]
MPRPSRGAERPRLAPVFWALLALVSPISHSAAQALPWPDDAWLRAHYRKSESTIRMRDGVGLATVIYTPLDRSRAWPILLSRTPYSAGPYGPEPVARYLGPGPGFAAAGYIFVTQDVRGRYRSGGTFEHMTPNRANPTGPNEVDETTDTWDTIDWLVKNVPGNNGRVGLWGISYGGYFAAEGLIRSHPALKAVSPQAPQADWFAGDDTHHNGAFFLTSTFNFMYACGRKGEGGSMTCGQPFKFPSDDGYRFFLDMGPLANAEARYFKGQSPGWTDMMTHETYDEFWQARSILPHLRDVKPAVLTVGGWYDANNFYGALHVFLAIERQSPGTDNAIVVGPWLHGQWARDLGAKAGDLEFGGSTSTFYQDEILLPFFESHLKGSGTGPRPKAWVFETGTNRWRTFANWPPREAVSRSIYFGANGSLRDRPPAAADAGVETWVSDPANPVPFVPANSTDMDPDYMARDQRFTAGRSDVVTYTGEPLGEDLSIGGPVSPELFVSTTGTDGDWVVRLIDVHPDGFQELVRGDVVRAKFRNSLTTPEPLEPGKVTRLQLVMPDVFHTFRKGHRMMVQVQGTWFPLVDRNPQRFVDIYRARPEDFQSATQRLHRVAGAASRIVFSVLPPSAVP